MKTAIFTLAIVVYAIIWLMIIVAEIDRFLHNKSLEGIYNPLERRRWVKTFYTFHIITLSVVAGFYLAELLNITILSIW